MEEIEKMSFPELIAKFERSIAYNCHSLPIKFERSSAQKELARRGRESLRPIIERLRQEREPITHYPLIEDDVTRAWMMLLNKIEIKVDPEKSGPEDLRDIEGWLSWAERFAN
jgi:hypothetical protein